MACEGWSSGLSTDGLDGRQARPSLAFEYQLSETHPWPLISMSPYAA